MNNAQLRKAAKAIGSSINVLKPDAGSSNRVLMGGILFKKIADTEYFLTEDKNVLERDLSDIMIGDFQCPRLDIDSTFTLFNYLDLDKNVLLKYLIHNDMNNFFDRAIGYIVSTTDKESIEEAVRSLFKYKLS